MDHGLVLCGYEEGPNGIAPGGRYRQLFGRNELKPTIINMLRNALANDETR